jgi:hypothetical protein
MWRADLHLVAEADSRPALSRRVQGFRPVSIRRVRWSPCTGPPALADAGSYLLQVGWRRGVDVAKLFAPEH